MKKKMFIMGLFVFLFIPSKIYAVSGNVSCSGPSSVELGESFNVTISGRADGTTDWAVRDAVYSSGNLSLQRNSGKDQ